MGLRALLVLFVSVFSMGCGAGGGPHGGDQNLPSAGSHPFEARESALLSIPGVDLRCPKSAFRDDGTPEMWVLANDGTSTNVLRFDWDDPGRSLASTKGTPIRLEGSEGNTLEGQWLDLAVLDEGPVRELVLLDKDGDVVLLREVEPTFFREEWRIPTETSAPGQVRSLGAVGTTEEWFLWLLHDDAGTLVQWRIPREAKEESDTEIPSSIEDWGDAALWESDGLSSLSVSVRKSPAGRAHYRLWYGGKRETAGGWVDGGLGFAASWDGQEWQKSPNGGSVVTPGLGEKEPMEWSYQGETYLIYSRFWRREGTNRHVIGVADYLE